MATNTRLVSAGFSSLQGLISGICIGFAGPMAFPFLLLTVALDRKAFSKWKLFPSVPSPRQRFQLAGSGFASMGVNALFSFIGITAMIPISPMGTTARQDFFKVMATPVVAQNTDALAKQSRSLLDTSSSYWLDTVQKSRLQTKLQTVETVITGVKADQALYDEGHNIANQEIDESVSESIISRANAVASNPRAALVLSLPVRERITKKAQEALRFAEVKEKERIARLPKKYQATMTNCFVDAPCESFERVAVVADGKVTVGDVSCPIQGQNDPIQGACSVAMAGGRPVSMREWDPADGFELTRISFGGQVNEGSYDPEMEANPYVKLQRERVAQVVQEWGREKENAKKNCKGLKGDAWTACAGAQTGN